MLKTTCRFKRSSQSGMGLNMDAEVRPMILFLSKMPNLWTLQRTLNKCSEDSSRLEFHLLATFGDRKLWDSFPWAMKQYHIIPYYTAQYHAIPERHKMRNQDFYDKSYHILTFLDKTVLTTIYSIPKQCKCMLRQCLTLLISGENLFKSRCRAITINLNGAPINLRLIQMYHQENSSVLKQSSWVPWFIVILS